MIALCVYNAYFNLEKQGIATGFDFLAKPAGFEIIMHLIPFSEESTYYETLIVSLLNTALVAFLGIIFSSVIGFVVGVSRLSSNLMIKSLASLYIEIFRNIPLLLQIFCWYFGILRLLPHPRNSIEMLPYTYLNIRGIYIPEFHLQQQGHLFFASIIIGFILLLLFQYRNKKLSKVNSAKNILIQAALILIVPCVFIIKVGPPILYEPPVLKGFNFQGGSVIIPELIAMLLALSTYTAAFIAEIVRGSILAIDKGQTEAALSLGLSKGQTLRLIVIPQAMRIIIPPLTNQYLNLTKNSSLGAAIAYPELVSVFAGTVLNQTGQAIEVIAITMAIYLSFSTFISLLMNIFNNKMRLKES